MFLRINNDDLKIKEQGWTNGSKKQNLQSKDDTPLPTVSTEGLMMPCVFVMMWFRDKATADIQWDFLQTQYDQSDIHIKMEGVMVTLM